MLILSIGVFFRGFNASRFVLYASVLAFTVLFALRQDNSIHISYLFIFGPLFICNMIVFIGALIGIISFILHPPPIADHSLRLDFFSMLFTTVEHAVLCSFEYLAAHKLDLIAKSAGMQPPWIIVFSPLFIQCCLAIFISVWAVRNEKSFEFELFFAVNIIQLVLVAFKLDKHVDWSWAVVFIPLWVVLSLSVVGVLYALILALLLTRSRHLLPAHRTNHIYGAILQTLLVVPALVSLVLLTGKLDSPTSEAPTREITYMMSAIPLSLSLFCLLLISFCSRGGNVWWFALRRPFCSFLLDACPCLKQYANVSYKIGVPRNERCEDEGPPPPLLEDCECRPMRPVVPITTIELPD